MKTEKLPKLIPGNMNIPYIKCKAGYADGCQKPKALTNRPEQEAKQTVTKLRKNEKLVA